MHPRPCSIDSSIRGRQAFLVSHKSISTGTHDDHQQIRCSRQESRSCFGVYEMSRDDRCVEEGVGRRSGLANAFTPPCAVSGDEKRCMRCLLKERCELQDGCLEIGNATEWKPEANMTGILASSSTSPLAIDRTSISPSAWLDRPNSDCSQIDNVVAARSSRRTSITAYFDPMCAPSMHRLDDGPMLPSVDVKPFAGASHAGCDS